MYAIIGTIWVVSFVGILHLASYLYHTIKEDPQQSPAPLYFWDAPRIIVSFCMALAIFYGGMARRVADLASAVSLQVAVRPPSLWPADIWLMMSLFCLGLALLSALVSINWSQVSTTTPRGATAPPSQPPQLPPEQRPGQRPGQRPDRRQTQALAVWEPLPTRDSLPVQKIPAEHAPNVDRAHAADGSPEPDRSVNPPALTGPVSPAPSAENPLQKSLQMLPPRLRAHSEQETAAEPYDITLGEERLPQLTTAAGVAAPVLRLPRVVRSHPWRSVRRWVLTAVLVCLGLLLAWQLVSRLNVFGSIGDFTTSVMLPERATPTPTPDLRTESLALEVNGAADAPAAEQAAAPSSTALEAVASPVQEAASVTMSQQSVAPTLPPAATPAPSPSPTPTPGIAQQQHVLIQNQYGVNARSEPSLTGAVQTVLPPDTRLPLLERTADQEWIRVQMEEGGEAWVAASVVTVVEPEVPPVDVAAAPATAAPAAGEAEGVAVASPSDPVDADSASAADTPADVPSEPAPTATFTPTPQSAADAEAPSVASAPVASAPVVNAAEAQSYTISLIDPEDGFTTSEDVTLRWRSGFRPAENQAFEPIVWRADGSPLQDGVSLGAPMRGGPGEVMQIEAALSSLESGEYHWGVLLVQLDPYQRLALMSGEWTIFVE